MEKVETIKAEREVVDRANVERDAGCVGARDDAGLHDEAVERVGALLDLRTVGDAAVRLERSHLVDGHEAGVIVLVPGER